jgi:hypothetical protein
MSEKTEYSPFARSRASRLRKKKLPQFYRSGQTIYYEGSKAWILKGEWVRGKLVKEEWVRARKYDRKT